jgi:hypothetical protein
MQDCCDKHDRIAKKFAKMIKGEEGDNDRSDVPKSGG